MREWLKKLRKEKNLTQQEVANSLEIVPSYYNMIENGERQSKMTLDMAQKLSRVFGISLEVVLQNEILNIISKKES